MKTAFCLSENDLKKAGVRAKATDYVQGHHWELRRRGKGMQLWWHESMLDPEWRVAPVVTPPAVTPETPDLAVEPGDLDTVKGAYTVETLRQNIQDLEKKNGVVLDLRNVNPVDAPMLMATAFKDFIITAKVKKLCKNQRFVILEDDSPVRTGKMLGKIKPGMRVMVKDGTIIKG